MCAGHRRELFHGERLGYHLCTWASPDLQPWEKRVVGTDRFEQMAAALLAWLGGRIQRPRVSTF
jgi:hypothetical protein